LIGKKLAQILVTGSSGYIGQNVIRELAGADVKVFAMTRKLISDDVLKRHKNLNFFYQNLENKFDIPGSITEGSHVLHLAWDNLSDYHSPAHEGKILQIHLRFLRELISRGVKSITVAGTCFEYGSVAGPVSSHAIANPYPGYATAKNQLRMQLQKSAENYGVNIKWGRIFYVYGKNDTKPSLFNLLDKSNEIGKSTLEMTDCEQIRDYLPVDQVAKQLISLTYCSTQGVFNICSSKPVRLKDIVKKYIRDNNYNVTPLFGSLKKPLSEQRDFWGEKKMEWNR
jgi:nucleoside-diphosphate-sugar epimerase